MKNNKQLNVDTIGDGSELTEEELKSISIFIKNQKKIQKPTINKGTKKQKA